MISDSLGKVRRQGSPHDVESFTNALLLAGQHLVALFRQQSDENDVQPIGQVLVIHLDEELHRFHEEGHHLAVRIVKHFVKDLRHLLQFIIAEKQREKSGTR